jgi:hypothetical protein
MTSLRNSAFVLRIFALPGGRERAAAFSGDFAAHLQDMGEGTDLLKKIGRTWWEKLEPELMSLLCNPANAELRQLTNNKPKSGSWVIATMGRIGAFDGDEHNTFDAFTSPGG